MNNDRKITFVAARFVTIQQATQLHLHVRWRWTLFWESILPHWYSDCIHWENWVQWMYTVFMYVTSKQSSVLRTMNGRTSAWVMIQMNKHTRAAEVLQWQTVQLLGNVLETYIAGYHHLGRGDRTRVRHGWQGVPVERGKMNFDLLSALFCCSHKHRVNTQYKAWLTMCVQPQLAGCCLYWSIYAPVRAGVGPRCEVVNVESFFC